MNFAILELVALGAAAITVALAVVLVMVYYELAPVAGLAGRRRWLLTAALGSGVLTFTFKLFLVVMLANHPPEAIPGGIPLAGPDKVPPAGPERYRWQELPSAGEQAAGSAYRWQSLPPQPALDQGQQRLVALGERLFFDRDLSRDRTLSCASCHDVRQGAGDDGRSTALGIDGQVGPRNTPSVWNTAYQARLFWDGRAASLEEQALGPMLNPIEMGMQDAAAVVQRVAEKDDYSAWFAAAFGDPAIDSARIAGAIAAYERTLVTADSPYDRFVRGDLDALTPAQLRGMALFESVGCVSCHSGPNFSAASSLVEGTPWRVFPSVSTPYEQRYRLIEDAGAAGSQPGRGIWRVPSLRNVALTAPYFHNGSVDNLEEAVRIMSAVQLGRTGAMLVWSDRDSTLKRLPDRRLDDRQVTDIVAFLNALSSEQLLARIAARDAAAVQYAAE